MIEVIYFDADDCFYCQHWEAARKPELMRLIGARKARLVEVKGETLKRPILERHYPADLKWLYRDLGELRSVPRFVLVVDGKVALRVHGTSNYSAILEPRLRAELARQRP